MNTYVMSSRLTKYHTKPIFANCLKTGLEVLTDIQTSLYKTLYSHSHIYEDIAPIKISQFVGPSVDAQATTTQPKQMFMNFECGKFH
jgi:hypothetical protein